MSNGRPWGAEDTATLRRMAEARYSDGEIARHMKRSRALVQRKRGDLKIPPGMQPALTMMMARLNARRFRLQNQSSSFA